MDDVADHGHSIWMRESRITRRTGTEGRVGELAASAGINFAPHPRPLPTTLRVGGGELRGRARATSRAHQPIHLSKSPRRHASSPGFCGGRGHRQFNLLPMRGAERRKAQTMARVATRAARPSGRARLSALRLRHFSSRAALHDRAWLASDNEAEAVAAPGSIHPKQRMSARLCGHSAAQADPRDARGRAANLSSAGLRTNRHRSKYPLRHPIPATAGYHPCGAGPSHQPVCLR